MLSLEEFRKLFSREEEILKKNACNYVGGYDMTKTTTADQNPYSDAYFDRMHYDYSYDGRQKLEDYRGRNYTLP